jgi:hypothetical protein
MKIFISQEKATPIWICPKCKQKFLKENEQHKDCSQVWLKNEVNRRVNKKVFLICLWAVPIVMCIFSSVLWYFTIDYVKWLAAFRGQEIESISMGNYAARVILNEWAKQNGQPMEFTNIVPSGSGALERYYK